MSKKFSVLLACLSLVVSCHVASSFWQNPEVVHPDDQIRMLNFFAWYERVPESLEIQYKKAKFEGKTVVNVYGYTERNTSKISKYHTPFALLTSAAIPDENSTDRVDILKINLNCNGKEAECNKFDMGYLEITLASDMNLTRRDNQISQIIPLGWLAEKNYKKDGFDDWAYGKCKNWATLEEKEEIMQDLNSVSCPVNLHVAQSDPAWFSKAGYLAGFPHDALKDSASNSSTISPMPEQSCFYSAVGDVGNTTMAAPASMCCYRNSDSNLLAKEFTSDANIRLHGSSVLRSHPFGLDGHFEHYKTGQVPYLSHWFWDKLPYLYCCHWWNGSACSTDYMPRRPVPQVKHQDAETASKLAYISESHVYPVAGNSTSSFCPSVGEYWLVRSDVVQVQVRQYVVSRYKGENNLKPSLKHSEFITAGSRSAFITSVAMRSMEAPDMVMELTCPEGEFHCYVQVTNKNSDQSWSYDGFRGRALGSRVLVGDVLEAAGSKKYTFMVKHSLARVAVIAHVIHPNDEFLSVAITLPESLMIRSGNISGLAIDGRCAENQVESAGDRLFGAACDNCQDFEKYRSSRPLYYEDIDSPRKATPEQGMATACTDDVCKYIGWSTNYKPYYDSIAATKTKELETLQTKLASAANLVKDKNKDKDWQWKVCNDPRLSGLMVRADQSFNESATLSLECSPPMVSSHVGQQATCKKKGDKLEFDVPPEFKCTVPEVIKQAETKAAANDNVYTKKYYAPEKAKEEAKKVSPRRLSPELLVVGLLLAFAEFAKRA